MEALVDGVFAIAMTILVLAVKVPELDDPSDGALLSQALYFALAKRRGLILPEVPAGEVRGAHRRNLWACAVFCIATAPAALMLGLGAAGASVLAGALLGWRAWRA